MVVAFRKLQMRHFDVLYRLLVDQEVDGSNPFARPLHPRIQQLHVHAVFLEAISAGFS
jgi:hypothetical protein